MPKIVKTDNFIDSCRKIHGDRYGYDHVVYVNAKTKVKIECMKHGIFEVVPYSHKSGTGCPPCSGQGKTTATFIEKAIEVHGDRYGYSSVSYTSIKEKVRIKCRVHGNFDQIADYHLSGNGCPMAAGVA